MRTTCYPTYANHSAFLPRYRPVYPRKQAHIPSCQARNLCGMLKEFSCHYSTKRLEKNLEGGYEKKSWKQHLTKQQKQSQLCPLSQTIKVFTVGEATFFNELIHLDSQDLTKKKINTVYSLRDLSEAMNDRGGWREIPRILSSQYNLMMTLL